MKVCFWQHILWLGRLMKVCFAEGRLSTFVIRTYFCQVLLYIVCCHCEHYVYLFFF
jgi:hypothetical protein